MLQHEHDENSAKAQADNPLPPNRDAARARGVHGAEPPVEDPGARSSNREHSAAGLMSIYETVHHGFGRIQSHAQDTNPD